MKTPGKKRKLDDGTIVYDVSYYDAASKRKMKTCYSALEAREFKAEKIRDKRLGVSVNDMKFGEFADKHHAFASMSQRERTIVHHESCLRNHLKPRFGDVWMSRITRDMVEDFLIELRDRIDPKTEKRKYAPRYLTDILKRLNVVLNAAVDRRIIQANPAARLGMLFKPKDDEPEVEGSFKEDELLRVLQCCRQTHYHCYPYFLLLARAGLRPGEGLALEWRLVDFEKGVIAIQQAMGPKGDIQKTKTSRHRVVDMSEQLITTLAALRNAQTKAAFSNGATPPTRVFPGVSERHFGNRMKILLRRTGLPRHFHPMSLRHTFARLLLEKGIRVEDVQRRMGHKDVNMTNAVYGRWADLSGQEAVNRLDPKSLDETNLLVLQG